MKTLQIRAGRWHAVTAHDGSISCRPKMPGISTRDVAIAVDAARPPLVTEVIGTGVRLHEQGMSEVDGWKVYDNNAQALAAAAFRIKETA